MIVAFRYHFFNITILVRSVFLPEQIIKMFNQQGGRRKGIRKMFQSGRPIRSPRLPQSGRLLDDGKEALEEAHW